MDALAGAFVSEDATCVTGEGLIDMEPAQTSLADGRVRLAGGLTAHSDERVRLFGLRGEARVLQAKDTSVVLEDLTECDVLVEGTLESLTLRSVCSSTVKCAIAVGSVYVDGCRDCTLHVGGDQVRMHDSANCTVHLFARSGCVLEGCSQLHFYEYADGACALNRWKVIRDFTPGSSPNYCVYD